MNCPSRNDPEALEHSDYNQNPHPLSLKKNSDMNGLANRRLQRDHRLQEEQQLDDRIGPIQLSNLNGTSGANMRRISQMSQHGRKLVEEDVESLQSTGNHYSEGNSEGSGGGRKSGVAILVDRARALRRTFVKFGSFVGPGFMVAVAYIDPGNYATDVAAGASYKFQLLCIVLFSNIIAIFLQSLSIKLGSVTGMNLAENCKAHCPSWLNYVLYVFAEAAIIATDIAEVIGTAIALNLLLHIPLVAGCAISIVDVLIILAFYRPSGTMRGIRVFELFVALLVLAVVVCFCIELSLISVPNIRELFRGYLPSDVLVQSQGLYQACGILGATVMPHSLYLGSGIVQPRLYDYDLRHGNITTPLPTSASTTSLNTVNSTASSTTSSLAAQDSHTAPLRKSNLPTYRPSLAAIKSCLSYSIVELTISLFTFALFVNSAILIVAGASLSGTPEAASADLFGIYHLLSSTLAPAAATIFALALLLSGTSAGIVCTIAGQMVSEGQLNWSVKPWVRRLITRSISITPSIIIAGAVGQDGLSRALEGSQVALSVILPVTSAPLIWFTMRSRFMMVDDVVDEQGHEMVKESKTQKRRKRAPNAIVDNELETDTASQAKQPAYASSRESISAVDRQEEIQEEAVAGPLPLQRRRQVNMKNHWVTSTFAVAMWALIVFMNVASWVMMGLGN